MFDYLEIFDNLTHDPRYLDNLDWGKPRRGHPEATIRAHIEELERNLAVLMPRLTEEEVLKLRILIHTHDSFKPDARRGVPIIHPMSHASLASRFLAEFCDDKDLLAMVQFHDEPYACWQRFRSNRPYDERLGRLRETIVDWSLFLDFVMIDNCTVGKSPRPTLWLLSLVGDGERLADAHALAGNRAYCG